jgi:hypothetical protein
LFYNVFIHAPYIPILIFMLPTYWYNSNAVILLLYHCLIKK